MVIHPNWALLEVEGDALNNDAWTIGITLTHSPTFFSETKLGNNHILVLRNDPDYFSAQYHSNVSTKAPVQQRRADVYTPGRQVHSVKGPPRAP